MGTGWGRIPRRVSMAEAGARTHVLLMPRDLTHRAVTDPDHRIGCVRDLLNR